MGLNVNHRLLKFFVKVSKCLICELSGSIKQKIESAKSLKEAKNLAIEEGLATCYVSHIQNHRKYHQKIVEDLGIVNQKIPKLTPQLIFDKDFSQYGTNHQNDLTEIQLLTSRIFFKILFLTDENLNQSMTNNELPSKDLIDSLKKVSDVYARFLGTDVIVNVNKSIEFLTSLGYKISEE